MLKKRSLICFILAAGLALCAPLTAAAGELSPEERVDIAADLVKEIMELILDEYVGGEVTPEELYEGAVRGMADSLDPYSEYFSSDELEDFSQTLSAYADELGIIVELGEEDGAAAVVSVARDSPAAAVGFAVGDVLLTINGEAVSELTEEQIYEKLCEFGENDVECVVLRDGAEIALGIGAEDFKRITVHAEDFEGVLDYAAEYDNKGIKYIKIDIIGEDTDDELRQTIEELRAEGVTGVVLDLRGNPGGYMHTIVDICCMLVPEGPIMYITDSEGSMTAVTSPLEVPPFRDIVLLTDERTASASEILASALQDSGAATVVGETTFGKGVIQSIYNLSLGGALKLTTEEYLRRNGTKLDKIGIEPDVLIAVPDLIRREVKLDGNNAAVEMPTVKSLLSFLGYDVGEPDEYYDVATRESIRLFQEQAGLPSTGDIDYETQSALNVSAYTAYYQLDMPLQKAYELLRNMKDEQ